MRLSYLNVTLCRDDVAASELLSTDKTVMFETRVGRRWESLESIIYVCRHCYKYTIIRSERRTGRKCVLDNRESTIAGRARRAQFRGLIFCEFSRDDVIGRAPWDTAETRKREKEYCSPIIESTARCINIHSHQKRNKARNPSRHCYAAGAHSFFTPGHTSVLRARRVFPGSLGCSYADGALLVGGSRLSRFGGVEEGEWRLVRGWSLKVRGTGLIAGCRRAGV